RMRRIGVLIVGLAEGDREIRARLATFREALEKHGWSEGKNVRIDARFAASSTDKVHEIAKELVALPADVIIAHTTPAAARAAAGDPRDPDRVHRRRRPNQRRSCRHPSAARRQPHRLPDLRDNRYRQVAWDAQGDRPTPSARRTGGQPQDES